MDSSQLKYLPLLAGSDPSEQQMRRERDLTFAHKFSIASDTLYNQKSDVRTNAPLSPHKAYSKAPLNAPEINLKLRVCEVEGCGVVATGGCCDFKVFAGVSKGCGRNFCVEHSGAREEDSDFQVSNIDEFQPAPSSFDEELGQDRAESAHNRPRPFDGQVCSECRPRLRRAYRLSTALLCGIPSAISLACVIVYGGAV